jgi:hypothetical protein
MAANRSSLHRAAAMLYMILAAAVVLFQLALAAGAPWGAYAMAGAFPGRLPASLRVGAALQAVMISAAAVVILARANVVYLRWSRLVHRLTWVIVTVMGVSLVLNVMTPSTGERAIWAPVALMLFATSVVVANGPRA